MERSQDFTLLEFFLDFAFFLEIIVFLGRNFVFDSFNTFLEPCLFLYLFIDFYVKFVHVEEGMAFLHLRVNGFVLHGVTCLNNLT